MEITIKSYCESWCCKFDLAQKIHSFNENAYDSDCGLTNPKIGHTMCYSFEFDEKIVRSLNNLSRNFEFHQPECLKCLLMRGHIFGGGIL